MKKKTLCFCLCFLFMVMYPVSLLGSFPVPGKPDDWWYTISDTYYYCPSFALFTGACAVLLILYSTDNLIEKIITRLTGLISIAIILFPCANPTGAKCTGFFQVPDHISDTLHYTFSFLLILVLFSNAVLAWQTGKDRRTRIAFLSSTIIISISSICFGLAVFKVFSPIIKPFSEEGIFLGSSLYWLIKGISYS